MAVQVAQAQLTELGIPHRRPDDYFAEMVKTDSHMARVKGKLIKQQTDAKEADERRKARDNKKFGKQFQVAKAQERQQKKKANIDSVAKGLKRGRPSSLDDDEGGGGFGAKRRRPEDRASGDRPGSKFKPGGRDAKEERFKRTHKDKRNSKESADDSTGFNGGKWGVGGAKKGNAAKKGSPKPRPGKARREQTKRK
jgi:rRNA-processing protein EBP2